MRPLQLSMTAFGPFAQNERIDFTTLGENPLFLINGPTGAGKTTILDAICFALYGQTTGAEREGRQMRCDFADEDRLTEVEFIFELNNKQYRIHRIPEQSKPRKRRSGKGTGKEGGEGDVLQKPTATLHALDGKDENLLANKVTDATKSIEELTGLKIDQFRQVMVLPQGKFRKLLMADSKDREQIFSQLFQTHIYKRIEDHLNTRAKNVRIAVAKLRENQLGILQSVEMESIDQLQTAIASQQVETTARQDEHQVAQAAYLTLSKKLQEMENLAQQFVQLEQQQEKQASLEIQAKEIEHSRQQLRAAEIAEGLKPIYQQHQRCSQEKKVADKEFQQVQNTFKHQKKSLKAIEQQVKFLPEQQAQLEVTQKKHNELSAYQKRAQQLDSIRIEYIKTEHQFQQQKKRLNQQEQENLTLVKQHKKIEARKGKLEQQQTNEAEIKTQLTSLQTQWEIVQERDTLYKQLTTKQQQLVTMEGQGKVLKEALENAETKHKQLDLHWHNAQAVILASQLQQDEACPVCGSTEHPKPAHMDNQDIPTEQQREMALQQVETLRTSYLAARENYSALQTATKKDQERHDKLQNDVNTSAEQLQEHITQTQIQLKAWEQQQADLQKLQQQLKVISEQENQQSIILDKQINALAERQAAFEASKALVKKAEQELPESYREQGVLAQALQDNKKNQQALQNNLKQIRDQHITISKQFEGAKTALQVAEKTLNKSLKQDEKASKDWQRILSDSIFVNQAEYEQSLCSEGKRKQFKIDIKNFDQQYQQLQGAITQQQAALEKQQRPDLVKATEQLTQKQNSAAQIESAWQQANALLQQLENARKKIQEVSAKQQSEEATYKIIGTLADVANGQTGNKISLQRFVLGVLLDDVLIAASQRLTRMSKGRYQLLRKEERAKGNKASGLELEVADGYTGKTRPVATLSGGESFIASLSLALGLSEVVQAYAGGVHLDTLFVDEGFGSLDADSLDTAIRTLIDLRESGRMVGIISHVSELKEQINQRIDLTSDQQGSHVKITH